MRPTRAQPTLEYMPSRRKQAIKEAQNGGLGMRWMYTIVLQLKGKHFGKVTKKLKHHCSSEIDTPRMWDR